MPDIKDTLKLPFIIGCLLMMSGCGPNVPTEVLSTESLDTWMQQKAVPYLTQRFSQHPRFKDSAFSIKHMSFGQIDPSVDALSANVIEELITQLQQQPVSIMLAGQTDPCQQMKVPRYLVGVDARISAQGYLEVRIDAYDLLQENWTSGFEIIWRGVLSAENQTQLAQHTVDQTLVGKKFLPFQESQSPLLIKDFHQALVCFAQEHASGANVMIKGKYLPKKLEQWMHVIQQGGDKAGQLAQLVATAINREDNLFGLTLAINNVVILKRYIRLKKEKTPVIVAEAITVNPLQISEKSAEFNIPILQESTLIKPHGNGLCATKDPWVLGESVVVPHSKLSSDNCFAVKLTTQRTAFPIIISRNGTGQLSRLHPTLCKYLDDVVEEVTRDSIFYYPTRSAPVQALGLDESLGEERIYILLAASRQIQADILLSIKTVPTLCAGQKNAPVSVRAWEKKLELFRANHPGMFQWQVHTFMHIPASEA